jgi:hypothetical protein
MPCAIAANEQRDLQADNIMERLDAFTSFENDLGASEIILASGLTAPFIQGAWVTLTAKSRWWRAKRRREPT